MATDPLAKVEASVKAAAEGFKGIVSRDMPATVYRIPSGDFIVEDDADPRGWRAANSDEISGMTPNDVEFGEPGTTFQERFTVKNLASNLETAKAYLETRGYEVRPFPPAKGANFNLLIRKKGANEYWRPIDPVASLNPIEFLRDISDWSGDMMVGMVSAAGGIAGAPAGPAGVAGGFAAGALAGETIRQGIGEVGAGIPTNVQPMEAVTSATFAPLGPPAAKMASAPLRAIGRGMAAAARPARQLQRELSASIIGIEKRGTLDPDEILNFRAEDNREFLPTLRDVAEKITGFFMALERKGPKQNWLTYPEKVAAVKMEADATAKGITTDMRPLSEAIWKTLSDPEKTSIDKNLGNQVEGLAEMINGYLGRKMGADVDISKVPIDVAVNMKRMLQTLARQKGGFRGNPNSPVGEHFRNLLTQMQSEARISVLNTMKERGYPEYIEAMAGVEFKENMRRQFKTVFGIGRKDFPSGKGQVPYTIQQRVEQYLNTTQGTSKGTGRQLIVDLEKTFGVKLEREIIAANVGSILGKEGKLSWKPRFTATGRLLNLSTIAGLTGFATRSPAIGAGVFAAGVAGASPALQLSLTRGVNAASREIPASASALLKAANQASPAFAVGGARSVIVSEDERRKKRGPLVLGE